MWYYITYDVFQYLLKKSNQMLMDQTKKYLVFDTHA